MKDIKSLYNSAKYKPTAENISAYKEAINDLMENSPYEYVSKAEYIITSSFGANTLNSFIEKNGLPIASFNNIMSILESAIKKCKSNDINYDSFKEAYNALIDFREKYEKCFDMFDYYNEDNNESYIETYYGKNKDDIPNKNIISGMIKSFKELAIPDTLITAHRLSEKANDKLLDFIINEYKENHLICEWVLEVEISLNDIKNNEKLDVLQENSLSYIINGIKEREHKLFRESVILGEDYTFECSDEEYENIKNLIFFKEYKLYSLNDVYSEEASIIKDEILNLYRLLSESYYREGDADIVQLLPNDMPKEESTWASNTTDKKNGKAPGYISNNHDMSSWGEEDKPKSSTVDNSDTNDEYDYKDYKRPSADNSSYDDTTSTTDEEEDDEESEVKDKESLKQQAVNNYYYYSYNNSLNKNQNSFNKDNSRHDNHSVKHINSHNTSNGTSVAKEACQLNIFDDYLSEASEEDDDYFQEGLMDKIKNVSNKVMSKIKTFVFRKKNLYNLQMMDKPGFVKPQPNVLFGIDLNKGNSKIENKNEYVESILESGIQSLSKNDIKNIVNKLKKKFNVEIYFINSNSKNVNPDEGIVCVESDQDTIDKLIKGKPAIKEKLTRLNGADPSTLKKVILVNTKLLLKDVKTAKDVEMSVSHEYGHVLTIDQLSQQDWVEYYFKIQEMANMLGRLEDELGRDNMHSKFYTEFIYYGYYNLKPEKLANESGKVDARELVKSFTGRYPDESKLKDIDFKAFAEWKFPDEIKKIITEYIISGKIYYDEIPVKLKEAIRLYKTVIKNQQYAKIIIEPLEKELMRFQPIKESVGDADNDRPESDHPIKDTLTDIDREISKHQQGMKKKVQDVQNAGRAAAKPFKRMSQWVNNMISNLRDKDETKAKEKLADPHARKNLFHAIGWLIKNGSLLKAGILLNPIFLMISIYRKATAGSREFRLRNEMIGELKTEIEIIDEKIQDADRKQDLKAKYQLMRFKNEMNKKLLRVGGGKQWKKII